jgi:hypothetical protein
MDPLAHSHDMCGSLHAHQILCLRLAVRSVVIARSNVQMLIGLFEVKSLSLLDSMFTLPDFEHHSQLQVWAADDGEGGQCVSKIDFNCCLFLLFCCLFAFLLFVWTVARISVFVC